MADTQHTPEMNSYDRLTVILYRAGLMGSALMLLVAAGIQVEFLGTGNEHMPYAWFALAIFTALAAACVHIYARWIRWIITMSVFTGLIWLMAALLEGITFGPFYYAGIGFLFIALSAFAIKEQFCFRIPFLRAVPLLLAISLIPLTFELYQAASALLTISALIYLMLAAAKMRMPLHFDIGDKSRYEI